jgi:hypothetical protein
MEIWKDIEGYENLYKISNLSNVKSLSRKIKTTLNKNGYYVKKDKILKPMILANGYKYVLLYKNKKTKIKYIHRLVAQAFIPNPENKLCINHKDLNKFNNSIENLEWCTKSENSIHYWLNVSPDKTNRRKVIMLDLHGKKIKQFNSLMEAERETGILHGNISMVCNEKYPKIKTTGGYKWKYSN